MNDVIADPLERAVLMVLGKRRVMKTYDILRMRLSPRLGDHQLELMIRKFSRLGLLNLETVQHGPFDGYHICRITPKGIETVQEIVADELEHGYPSMLYLMAEHFLAQLPSNVARPELSAVENRLRYERQRLGGVPG
jgi:hypothetical protein